MSFRTIRLETDARGFNRIYEYELDGRRITSGMELTYKQRHLSCYQRNSYILPCTMSFNDAGTQFVEFRRSGSGFSGARFLFSQLGLNEVNIVKRIDYIHSAAGGIVGLKEYWKIADNVLLELTHQRTHEQSILKLNDVWNFPAVGAFMRTVMPVYNVAFEFGAAVLTGGASAVTRLSLLIGRGVGVDLIQKAVKTFISSCASKFASYAGRFVLCVTVKCVQQVLQRILEQQSSRAFTYAEIQDMVNGALHEAISEVYVSALNEAASMQNEIGFEGLSPRSRAMSLLTVELTRRMVDGLLVHITAAVRSVLSSIVLDINETRELQSRLEPRLTSLGINDTARRIADSAVASFLANPDRMVGFLTTYAQSHSTSDVGYRARGWGD